MGIRFAASAIKANFLVENPGWYNYECVKVLEMASDKASTNYIFIFEGRPTPGTSDEMNGVPVSKLVNEKADWVMYPIFKAANEGKDLPPDTEIDPKSLVGVHLCAMTKRGARQDGTPMNDLVDFRPVS